MARLRIGRMIIEGTSFNLQEARRFAVQIAEEMGEKLSDAPASSRPQIRVDLQASTGIASQQLAAQVATEVRRRLA